MFSRSRSTCSDFTGSGIRTYSINMQRPANRFQRHSHDMSFPSQRCCRNMHHTHIGQRFRARQIISLCHRSRTLQGREEPLGKVLLVDRLPEILA